MWKDILEYSKKVVSLTSDVKQNSNDITKVRDEVKELRAEVNLLRTDNGNLQHIVSRQADKLDQYEKDREKDRVIHEQQIELILLRYERGLPPSKPTEITP